MSQAQLLPTEHFSPSVSPHNGRPATTSLEVSRYFNKRHDHVVRSIRDLLDNCPKEFTAPNFGVSEYTDETGRTLPLFILYRDGFMLLVMGYTGKKALAVKLAYIEAFNRLEAELASQRGAALPEVPHIAITPSTTASRKPLEKLVKVWARQSGLIVGDCWTMLNAAFNLQSITELPEEWIPDAIAWVQGKIDNLTPALPAAEPVPAPALPATDDIDGHFAAIREHIRQINNHEDAIFQAARKGMPPLRGTNFLALLIHRNMENAGWSLHYALKSLETSARIAVTAGQI
ncbi:Rha family transcriptional regulator [uncultured Desulfovibrio sp.]|uniref:Rha family transcriptional regulator n=1 Tax=uncultured Desulfovibrio sp. TaxID=167968 RepID=UPI0020512A0B|nr:Rha family transcriptional regulator [uncultured Desulfovibrio sp.]DAX01793.1 MAG TPA: regulatory protein [Bacteriophage sp.]